MIPIHDITQSIDAQMKFALKAQVCATGIDNENVDGKGHPTN